MGIDREEVVSGLKSFGRRVAPFTVLLGSSACSPKCEEFLTSPTGTDAIKVSFFLTLMAGCGLIGYVICGRGRR